MRRGFSPVVSCLWGFLRAPFDLFTPVWGQSGWRRVLLACRCLYIIQMNKVTLEQLATMSMAQLVTLSGASQFEIQNWMARLPLTTRYAKTTQGKARGFNRDNAVEICLLARLVRAGVSPAVAAERVRLLFDSGNVAGFWVGCCLSATKNPRSRLCVSMNRRMRK
jgi:hypothetical protein